MIRGKYTVNEVEERTKVPASTLRQWERRYGFPKPERSEAGYRLYSEQDLGYIDAMKRHIAEGIPASRAAELVRGVLPPVAQARPVPGMQEELAAALAALDEEAADRVLGEAHSLHPVEVVVLQLMAGAVGRLGELWQQGSIEGIVVGAACSHIHGRLRGLLAQTPQLRGAPLVLVAGAPGNRHELAPLMLTLMLRRSGFRARYLGADAPVGDLAALAERLKPFAVMVSAAALESIEALERERATLLALPTMLVVGGAAFNRFPDTASDLGGLYLGRDIAQGVARFRNYATGAESA